NLLNAEVTLRVHDPKAMDNIRDFFKDRLGKDRLVYCKGPYEAAQGADALVIVTEWDEYRKADLAKLKTLLGGHVIFDGRNIFDPATAAEAGFTYYPVGRGGK